MFSDPIVEEIRRTRQKLFDECGGNMKEYLKKISESVTIDRSLLVTKENFSKYCKNSNSHDQSKNPE